MPRPPPPHRVTRDHRGDLMRPDLEIRIRAPIEGDWAFISDSYRKSYREQYPWVSTQDLYQETTRRLAKYRSSKDTRFLVACDPEDSEFILGWVCLGRRNLVHYLFVKQAFRGAKVAKRLCGTPQGHVFIVTHWSRACEKINRAGPILRYEPSKK